MSSAADIDRQNREIGESRRSSERFSKVADSRESHLEPILFEVVLEVGDKEVKVVAALGKEFGRRLVGIFVSPAFHLGWGKTFGLSLARI